MKTLSLIVPYRNRPLHLKCMLDWFAITAALNEQIELILVEYSEHPTEGLQSGRNIKYVHEKGNGNFNIAKLLNIGLANSKAKMVTAYDVDLVPLDLSFRLHIELTEKLGECLVTGHRLYYNEEYLSPLEIEQAKYRSAIAKDDTSEKFLKMQLIDGQRFGVLPFFNRKRMLDIGGWDERFEGWGGEDQDLIERYLDNSRYLLKCPDLLYIHLKHSSDTAGWNDQLLTQQNTQLYHAKREKQINL
ncbi:MAG TPA: galactosyltransferase-related protein [Chitinophagaceae bacterium]|nr:galactosyltransferase-related protein [Chitinophagaceae bacterium]